MVLSPGNALKNVYHSFRKPKVTIVIIVVLLTLFVAGLVIPQKVLYASRAQFDQWNADHPVLSRVINGLRLNEIYVAPITIFFLVLFFLNLLIVLAHRVPLMLRRAYVIDRQSATSGLEQVKHDPGAISIVVDGRQAGDGNLVAGQAASFFRSRFWSVLVADDARSFVAVRNRFSPIGFFFFHLSFLFCLIGGLLVMYTRFSGDLTLTEGEEFYSDIAQFRTIRNDPKIFSALPELGIRLLKVSPNFEGTTGTDLNVALQIRYFSETFDAIVKVNQPVRKGAVAVLPQDIGISPLFILGKRGGEEVAGGYFSLNILKGKEDSFQFPGLPYTVFVRFYPDYADENGKPTTKSLTIRNPVFHLRIQEKEKVLFDALRRPGEPAAFGSLDLTCREIRYWVDLLIVREYGTIPLYAGFLTGVVGLIMRLIFYQKTIRGHVEERDGACILYLGGRSEYDPQTFREELERVAADLGAALKNKAEGGISV